jgi:prophage regulatory protein
MSIMRIPAVQAELGWRAQGSVYNAIRAGLFTKPVKIGARAVGWPDDEVRAICAARIAGRTADEIRELVDSLHAKRGELMASLVI